MEGFLQALKFKTPEIQRKVCKLSGFKAKKKGKTRNWFWQAHQILWWSGCEYQRSGPEYQRLLDKAFDALFLSRNFRRALKRTGRQVLTHKVGHGDARKTVLTEEEFRSRLYILRKRLAAA